MNLNQVTHIISILPPYLAIIIEAMMDSISTTSPLHAETVVNGLGSF